MLNEMQILVLATKTMRFTESEALEYLKSKGHKVSKATYYNYLKDISVDTRKRLYDICKNFNEHHLERIDSIRAIEKQMWKESHMTRKIIIKNTDSGYDKNGKKYSRTNQEIIDIPLSPLEKVKILKEIADLQPYISAYEEATQSILEQSIKQFGKEEGVDLSGLGL